MTKEDEAKYPTPEECFPVKEQKYIRRFPSGAVRGNNKGRIRPDWISPYAIEEISKVLIENENDFGACNYMLGIPEERCLESIQRHILELQEAILIKKDFQEAKIIARSVGFNVVAMLHTMVLKEKGLYKEVYDREEVVTVEEAKNGLNYIDKSGTVKSTNKYDWKEKPFETIDLKHSLYNPDIWPDPFPKPYDDKLGLDLKYIGVKNIPFDWRSLASKDKIINQEGEILQYEGEGNYRLSTTNGDLSGTTWLVNWFSKWRKV